ncbi:DUF664 domain-containing protein [Propioniciclava soli]|uniref:DUF664 domain-containing protein n=1 Tax=Propioniciclava soli TaxID=2775081 RepID=A0ABZ3C9F0_9ACTN
MDTTLARTLLLDVFDRFAEGISESVTDLDEDALRWRPAPDANPIGWIAWHVLRVQDDHLAELGGVQQAWFAQGWQERFALPYDEDAHGYGQSADEVSAWRGTADHLAGYAADVHALTRRVLVKLSDYERVVDESYDPPVTAASRLVSVVNEVNQHLGQIAYLRGMLPNGPA